MHRSSRRSHAHSPTTSFIYHHTQRTLTSRACEASQSRSSSRERETGPSGPCSPGKLPAHARCGTTPEPASPATTAGHRHLCPARSALRSDLSPLGLIRYSTPSSHYILSERTLLFIRCSLCFHWWSRDRDLICMNIYFRLYSIKKKVARCVFAFNQSLDFFYLKMVNYFCVGRPSTIL